MPRIEIEVTGESNIDLALRTLGPKIEKRILAKAFRVGAKVILRQAQVNLAGIRSTKTATGRKSRRMRHHTSQISRRLSVRALRRRKNRVGVTVQTPTREKLGIPAGDKWYYPAHIELGTRRTTAQPYLRNAFDAKIKEVEGLVIVAINEEIDKALQL